MSSEMRDYWDSGQSRLEVTIDSTQPAELLLTAKFLSDLAALVHKKNQARIHGPNLYESIDEAGEPVGGGA